MKVARLLVLLACASCVQQQVLDPAYVILRREDRPLTWLVFDPVCVTQDGQGVQAYLLRGDLCSNLPYAGILSSFAPYNDKYQFIEETDHSPIVGLYYVIQREDGRQEDGVTDAQGNTHRVGSIGPEVVVFYLE